MLKYSLLMYASSVWFAAAPQVAPPPTTADLQVAYTLCIKRYVNRDKSVDAKWQPGYEDCDGVVAKYEAQQRAWDDVSQHRSKIKAIAGAPK